LIKEKVFYKIEEYEFKTLFNFLNKDTNQNVYTKFESLLNLISKKENVFLFKKNEIIFLNNLQFLLKKESETFITAVIIGSFLTTKKIIEIGIIRFEITKIKKGHYFRIVPSPYLSVLEKQKNLILPEIFEIKELEVPPNETILALLK